LAGGYDPTFNYSCWQLKHVHTAPGWYGREPWPCS
jgi:hypothetical protein